MPKSRKSRKSLALQVVVWLSKAKVTFHPSTPDNLLESEDVLLMEARHMALNGLSSNEAQGCSSRLAFRTGLLRYWGAKDLNPE